MDRLSVSECKPREGRGSARLTSLSPAPGRGSLARWLMSAWAHPDFPHLQVFCPSCFLCLERLLPLTWMRKCSPASGPHSYGTSSSGLRCPSLCGPVPVVLPLLRYSPHSDLLPCPQNPAHRGQGMYFSLSGCSTVVLLSSVCLSTRATDSQGTGSLPSCSGPWTEHLLSPMTSTPPSGVGGAAASRLAETARPRFPRTALAPKMPFLHPASVFSHFSISDTELYTSIQCVDFTYYFYPQTVTINVWSIVEGKVSCLSAPRKLVDSWV